MALATEPIDRAFLAEIETYLAGYGLKVTKARATRGSTSTEPTDRTDGTEPVKVKASKRHGSCAAHFRVPGMREPVCISPATDESGAPVPTEWSDVDTVLAFAVDVGARAEEHRTRASVGYVPTVQDEASLLPEHLRRTTFDAELARKVTYQARMRATPHPFAGKDGRDWSTCAECGVYKGDHIREQAA